MQKSKDLQVPSDEHLVFEREVGGLDGELTVTCRPVKDELPKDGGKAVSGKKADCALTPEQIEICDHATD
ncbi:MAG TPA: hypothetical protein VLZ84_09440 [Asticcacaulis sp.]|nr:hypothetical protein [Asticcacaulis sp.]